MATLQIRDLTDPLQQACGGDPRERRRQGFDPAPEELIRQDRSR